MNQFAFEIAQPAALTPVNNPREKGDPFASNVSEKTEVIPCITCGRFAFVRPTVCFWCVLEGASPC